jgi:hypothetical protein
MPPDLPELESCMAHLFGVKQRAALPVSSSEAAQ